MSKFRSKGIIGAQSRSVSIMASLFEAIEDDMIALVPEGRYRSIAMTKLEEAAMFVNKAIAHEWENR